MCQGHDLMSRALLFAADPAGQVDDPHQLAQAHRADEQLTEPTRLADDSGQEAAGPVALVLTASQRDGLALSDVVRDLERAGEPVKREPHRRIVARRRARVHR